MTPKTTPMTSSRRTFLKASGALAAGAVAGGLLQAGFRVFKLDGGLSAASSTRVAMGTFVSITALHASRDLAQEAVERAFGEIDRLAALLTRHDAASPLAILNREGSLASPPPELLEVLRRSVEFHALTGGAFDITVKPVLDLLESGAAGTAPSPEAVRAALARVNALDIELSPARVRLLADGMGVTLDGIAKGYIVDRACVALADAGIENHLVNAGGDIRTRGQRAEGKPWTIAVEDPAKKAHYPQVIRLTDGAVATSGSYEVFFDDQKILHHLIDPETGASPAHAVSVSVAADSAMRADALSTAAFIRRPADSVRMVDAMAGAETLIIGPDGSQFMSRGWDALRA